MDRRVGCYVALMFVEAAEENCETRASALAKQFGVPVIHAFANETFKAPPAGVKLIVNEVGLSLAFLDKSKGKPYFVDFLSATWKSRFHQPLAKNHIFRRALGVREEGVHLLDATAGLGQDAVLAASLGCKVTAVERSPVVAALLQDGIDRAIREDEFMRAKLKDLTLKQADSADFLKTFSPDVIYIDPMFDKPKKTAKSPKEMQLLQELLDPPKPDDEEKLFVAALAAAKSRVVVKRPLKARAVKTTPSHSFKGQSIRYDVYVK